jgi:hypothetical protein
MKIVDLGVCINNNDPKGLGRIRVIDYDDYVGGKSNIKNYEDSCKLHEHLSSLPNDKIIPGVVRNKRRRSESDSSPGSDSDSEIYQPKRVRYVRQQSIEQSLSCTRTLFDLYNINNKHKEDFDEEYHPGNPYHDVIIINLINSLIKTFYFNLVFFICI